MFACIKRIRQERTIRPNAIAIITTVVILQFFIAVAIDTTIAVVVIVDAAAVIVALAKFANIVPRRPEYHQVSTFPS